MSGHGTLSTAIWTTQPERQPIQFNSIQFNSIQFGFQCSGAGERHPVAANSLNTGGKETQCGVLRAHNITSSDPSQNQLGMNAEGAGGVLFSRERLCDLYLQLCPCPRPCAYLYAGLRHGLLEVEGRRVEEHGPEACSQLETVG